MSLETAQSEAANTPLLGAEEAAPVAEAPAAEAPAVEGEAPAVEGEAPAVETVAEEAVPESYEDFKSPEGVQIAPVVVDEVKAVAKELKLSQAEAQMLVDRLAPQAAKAQAEAFHSGLEKAKADWTTASRNDKEFGGDNFEKNLGGANQVLKTYGSPELRQLLIASGLSQHPEVIRFMVNVRKDVSEDRFIPGGKPVAAKPQGFVYAKSNMK